MKFQEIKKSFKKSMFNNKFLQIKMKFYNMKRKNCKIKYKNFKKIKNLLI